MNDADRLALHAQINSLRTALNALFVASAPEVQRRFFDVLSQWSAMQQDSDGAVNPETAAFMRAETAALDALHQQLAQSARLWRPPGADAVAGSTPPNG